MDFTEIICSALLLVVCCTHNAVGLGVELVVVPANMTVGHGSSMIMSCVAAVDGNGVEPIISWSLNGRTISTNNYFTTDFIISSKVIYKQELQGVMFVMSTLQVCGADVDKVGIYSCRAATSGESDAEYWTVDMHDAEEAELIFVSNSSSLPGLGDTVVLSCTASGFPLPTITFSKDGDDIETTTGSSTRVSDIVFSVTVLKTSSTSFIFSSIQICITEIDVYGQYSCTARNGIGSPQTHTWSLIPNSSGLEIAIAPASQTVKVGATVLMACVAYGFPYPDITFSKDGTALAWYNSNSISVTEMVGVEDSMAYSLSLISICNVEQGRYSCNARSDKETHTVSWDITYENILLLTTTTTSKAPIVTELPAELVVVPLDTQTVDHGSTVIISCVANGSPSPAITWSKGGTALTNSTTGGVKIYNRRINEGKFKLVQSNLVICGLRDQDTSLYKCEAANSIGKDYFDWELDVLPTKTTTSTGALTSKNEIEIPGQDAHKSIVIGGSIGAVIITILFCIIVVLIIAALKLNSKPNTQDEPPEVDENVYHRYLARPESTNKAESENVYSSLPSGNNDRITSDQVVYSNLQAADNIYS